MCCASAEGSVVTALVMGVNGLRVTVQAVCTCVCVCQQAERCVRNREEEKLIKWVRAAIWTSGDECGEGIESFFWVNARGHGNYSSLSTHTLTRTHTHTLLRDN